MLSDLPLFPVQASTLAGRTDALYFFLIALSAFFSLLIAGLIIYFAIRYRRRRVDDVGAHIHGGIALELVWSIIPLGLTMVIFVWGASVFFHAYRIPKGSLEIYAVGKQWMWKFQHMDGQREINELHVPVGRPVTVMLGSEDVIHSFYVPAFRVKQDVIPGRTQRVWFQATRPGRYHLFCAEYCGTKHSGMIGWVVAMEPADYQAWLQGGATEGSLASAGEKLFQDLACNTCHRADAQGRGPVLDGLFGRTVQLQNGQTVVADESYIRESIMTPAAKVVAGFQPVMPTFQGLVSEESLMQLIAYVKSRGPRAGGGASEVGGQNPAGAPRAGAPATPGRQNR
jgi:cytochrome c oxidase subunit 2